MGGGWVICFFMDKSTVYKCLGEKLRQELAVAVGASRDAADYATNEEARAESKYDTQGLEASYLAAGQAAHARELAAAVEELDALEEELTVSRKLALRGALVECQMGSFTEWFYLSPVGGGETIMLEGNQVTVITAHSPIGQALTGKEAGAECKLSNGASCSIKRIL